MAFPEWIEVRREKARDGGQMVEVFLKVVGRPKLKTVFDVKTVLSGTLAGMAF